MERSRKKAKGKPLFPNPFPFPLLPSPLPFRHSLRSKRSQSSYNAKVRAGAKKKIEGAGRGEKGKRCFLRSLPPPPSFHFFGSRPNFLDELARKRLLCRLISTPRRLARMLVIRWPSNNNSMCHSSISFLLNYIRKINCWSTKCERWFIKSLFSLFPFALELKEIRKSYKWSLFFWIDLLAILPIEVFAPSGTDFHNRWHHFAFLRLNRLIKAIRVR